MAKEIKTNKRILFDEIAKHLFCIDCKKRRPGCSPAVLQFGDTWNENGGKVAASITCKVEAEPTTKKARR